MRKGSDVSRSFRCLLPLNLGHVSRGPATLISRQFRCLVRKRMDFPQSALDYSSDTFRIFDTLRPASRFAFAAKRYSSRQPSRRLLARETRAHKEPVTSSSIFLGEIQPKKWKQSFSSTVVPERTKTFLPRRRKKRNPIFRRKVREVGEEITIKERERERERERGGGEERSAVRNNSCVFYRAGECFLAILGGASGGVFFAR